MMNMHRYFCWSLPNFVFATLLITFSAAEEICDKSKCPGPLAYYKGLDCKPVYNNTNDCCPESFDCSHLKNLSRDKCYVNGNEYSIGESLKDEDANACDIGCICAEGFYDRTARFSCGYIYCPSLGPNGNCFYKNDHDSCCSITRVCLKEGEKRATCEVDGRTYQEGEPFQPKSNPELDCYCMPDYKGENVAPFCKKSNRSSCNPLFDRPSDIHEKCVPVFYFGQNPQTDCNVGTRCLNEKDTVIHNHDTENDVETDESKMCRFGNLTMHIGDELSENTSFDSYCIKCVCEVPPIPTCKRREDNECAFETITGPIMDPSAPGAA
ncbi:uncharacterized protein LOC116431103 [Nomia melanderi]|uniref:uncharacterized protein LOC116431103 n=1 Tax=Nomia melanderi TaxID=2448451 RepID=UPI001304722C|nr:uncharacterized protein LOC116431103 [Nomia melanderi]